MNIFGLRKMRVISWLGEELLASHVLTTYEQYRVIQNDCRGFNNLSYIIHLREQYTYFFFNRTTLSVFITYLTGALYVHHLWFYKHQHDNRVRSACQRWWFQWRFWFVPSVPDTHAPCLLKLCILPSNGIVRWWLFPEFGAQLYPDNHFE